MKLDAALSLAEDRIRPFIREEQARLISEIEAMRRQHAAKGMLHSGATLGRICDLSIESLSRRIEIVFSAIKDSVGTVAPQVKDTQALMPIIVQFFPEDLGDQGAHIRKAIADLGVPNALQQLLDALATARANELQKAEANLKLFLVKLTQSTAPPSDARILGVLEIVLLLVTFSLAGFWIKNPSGPYEPYLVLVAAIITGIDLVKRWGRK